MTAFEFREGIYAAGATSAWDLDGDGLPNEVEPTIGADRYDDVGWSAAIARDAHTGSGVADPSETAAPCSRIG